VSRATEEGSVRARVGPAVLLLALAPLHFHRAMFLLIKIRHRCFNDFDQRISKCFGQFISKQMGIWSRERWSDLHDVIQQPSHIPGCGPWLVR